MSVKKLYSDYVENPYNNKRMAQLIGEGLE